MGWNLQYTEEKMLKNTGIDHRIASYSHVIIPLNGSLKQCNRYCSKNVEKGMT